MLHLPDPFFSDSQLEPDLFKSLRLNIVIESEATDDDALFAFIQFGQNGTDLVLALLLS